MNVYCPHCRALYRVDPDRVPATGVRVRCAACSGEFPLQRRGEVPAASDTGAAVGVASHGEVRPDVAAAASATPVQTAAVSHSAPAAEPDPQPDPVGTVVEPPPPESNSPGGAAAVTAAASSGSPVEPASPGVADGRAGSVFGPQDQDARARQLARALVSDIVAYNKDRRDRALAAGRLRSEFRGEIVKSWQEYVELVGDATAADTPHFRDALNEILARGQQVF